MFLTVHAASGLYLGTQVESPWLALILGFVSHWLLDLLPHGDENLVDKSKLTETELKKKLFYISALDTFGVIILFYLLTSMERMVLTPAILWGMLGALAPDYLWGLRKITDFNVLKPLHKIHNWFHHLLPLQLSLQLGGIVQLLALIIFILLIKT